MNIDLTATTSAQVNAAILDARHRSGVPALGMVLTLVIVTTEAEHYDALKASKDAAREHPSRILVAISRPGREEPRLDAELRTGGDSGPGETVLLRMYGELAAHADSVVLPLLLPDAPVVTWWPGKAPDKPSADRLGMLSQRRVTDAAYEAKPLAELAKRAAKYQPGDTDLSWTRLTTWRTLLAAALDEPYDPIVAAEVSAERDSPSAELLALWLGDRLQVSVQRRTSEGPGITGVVMRMAEGEISVSRPDGRLARLERPGWPERPVALHRRTTAELIAEELRRLDPDDVYGETLRLIGGTAKAAKGGRRQRTGSKSTSKRATATARSRSTTTKSATASKTATGKAATGKAASAKAASGKVASAKAATSKAATSTKTARTSTAKTATGRSAGRGGAST